MFLGYWELVTNGISKRFNDIFVYCKEKVIVTCHICMLAIFRQGGSDVICYQTMSTWVESVLIPFYWLADT